MFVTSDLFDLERIGRFRGFEWRENLVGGVVVHGTNWLGYEAAATYLLEAAKRCGVLEDMRYAGYSCSGDKRTRSILPKSFERLARGELVGAKDAESVLLRGRRPAIGAENGYVLLGGEGDGSKRQVRGPAGPRLVENYPYAAFDADFIFPLNDHHEERAAELFRLSVEILGAEYGYYFVRDDLCGPWTYAYGINSALHYGELADEEGREIGKWRDFVGSGQLWTGEWPLFRDLFQVNLLSERHTSTPVGGLGYLHEWITAETGRGRLEGVGKGRLLWILTDAEMFRVRPLLNEAGLLFSCRDRNYRDLLDAPVHWTPPPRWMQ